MDIELSVRVARSPWTTPRLLSVLRMPRNPTPRGGATQTDDGCSTSVVAAAELFTPAQNLGSSYVSFNSQNPRPAGTTFGKRITALPFLEYDRSSTTGRELNYACLPDADVVRAGAPPR